jgi:two-component system invasion response regulator UvrY
LNQSRTNKKELKQQQLTMVKSIDKNPFSSLSDREREILELMLMGESVKGISTSLSLKSNTISTYKKLIFYKTGVDNNIDLYKLARKHKIAK